VNGMTSIAKHLAGGVDVRLSVTVSTVNFNENNCKWTITSRLRDSSIDEHVADAIIVTAPLPQTIALLGAVADDLPRDLHDIDYDPTLCLLVTLKQQVFVSASGALQSPDDFFSFVCDNMRKEISVTPSMTFHVEPGNSAKHYDQSVAELLALMLEHTTAYFPIDDMIEAHVKKWRYATPQNTFNAPCWSHPHLPLVLAGDAFDGPRIEGAALSGLAAASVFS